MALFQAMIQQLYNKDRSCLILKSFAGSILQSSCLPRVEPRACAISEGELIKAEYLAHAAFAAAFLSLRSSSRTESCNVACDSGTTAGTLFSPGNQPWAE